MLKSVFIKFLNLLFKSMFKMEKQVYNRIKAVLAEQNKTNNWLADTLGMNRTTVSKWCRNEMQPRVETLFKIAKVLKVNVRVLLVATD